MKLTYQYKLRPTKEQNATMIEWLNLLRRQYNYRLGQRFSWWQETRTPVNSCPLNVSVVPVNRIYQDIPEFRVQVRDGRKLGDDGLPITQKGDKHPNIVGGYVQWQTVQLGDLKNTKKLFPEYKKIHSQVLQDVINRVETAFSNFITPDKNGNRAGKPKFKGLHYYKSFTYSQLRNKHILNNYVDLSGIGQVELVQHRPIPTGFVVKLGTVKLEADGWYLSLALEDQTVPIKEDEAICPTKENSCAIDIGLERFLTCDDGTYIEIPKFLTKASDRLARLQRAKSKHQLASKDKKRLYSAIAKLHQKIARQRQNFHLKIAYWLFSKADVVFIEDLKLKNLIRRNKSKPDGKGGFLPNNQSQSSRMNKSWLDAGHSSFFQILEWVAWKLGKRVLKVNPWGTSQHCYACLNKVPKSLSDRWHSCSCGADLNRDENSAKLQKLLGLELASIKTAPPRERGSLCTR
ncbi:MAG: RNA-guided endonuclease InsQ/TnpB family protein [Waterburya sp.]